MSEPTQNHLDEIVLHEYLDGALEAGSRLAVEAHLADCAVCAARLAELQALFTAIEALPDVPLPRDLAPEVVAALRGTRSASPILRWATALQLTAAIGLLFFAWPRIAGRLAGLDTAQIATGLADGARLWFAQWSAVLASVRELGAPDVEVMPRLVSVLELPSFAWWLLLVAALLLWLAGNGLLLRRFGEETNGG